MHSGVARYLEAADVARLVGLTPDAVRAAATAGRLRVAARTARGLRLFRKADVERWVADRAGKRNANG